jgi:hypothetical protein
MDVYQEMSYIPQLFLRDCKQHSSGFNFKHDCPTGQDKKRRGYILIKHDRITVYCHNCSLSTNLKKFIEETNQLVYNDYVEEERKEYITKLKEGKIFAKKEEFRSHVIESGIKDLRLFKFNTKYFVPAKTIPECVTYCESRKFPEGVIDKLMYCNHPKMFWGGMLIFPLYWKDGEHVYGFQGRSMKEKIFYNFSNNESFKVYNIFNVNLDKPVFIFESIIDSYYKENSIAVLGSSISNIVLGMIKFPVFCFDNDIRKDRKGLTQSIEYASKGHKVLVWPSELSWAKDPNDLAKKGWTKDQIERMINTNLKSGLGAVTAIKFKMRGKR